jgi:hypothetical protein
MCAVAAPAILALGRQEVSSLHVPLEEPLSPELALVCPELAELARPLLPEPGWLATSVKTESAGWPAPLQTLLLWLTCAALTVTPLVLTLVTTSMHAPHR